MEKVSTELKHRFTVTVTGTGNPTYSFSSFMQPNYYSPLGHQSSFSRLRRYRQAFVHRPRLIVQTRIHIKAPFRRAHDRRSSLMRNPQYPPTSRPSFPATVSIFNIVTNKVAFAMAAIVALVSRKSSEYSYYIFGQRLAVLLHTCSYVCPHCSSSTAMLSQGAPCFLGF